jgi:hypothetical protein
MRRCNLASSALLSLHVGLGTPVMVALDILHYGYEGGESAYKLSGQSFSAVDINIPKYPYVFHSSY